MHSLQLVQNACKYVLAQKMETMEDIFHVVSVGILYKGICKVGIIFQLVLQDHKEMLLCVGVFQCTSEGQGGGGA